MTAQAAVALSKHGFDYVTDVARLMKMEPRILALVHLLLVRDLIQSLISKCECLASHCSPSRPELCFGCSDLHV